MPVAGAVRRSWQRRRAVDHSDNRTGRTGKTGFAPGRLGAGRPGGATVEDLLDGLPFELSIALQPIIDLSTGAVAAVEALARFTGAGDAVPLPVEETFTAAYAAGRGPQLEAACLRAALDRRSDLPARVFLSVNVSPDALAHPAVAAVLADDLAGVIIEVTEHAAREPGILVERLSALRRRGAAIAVDDASKGHSGLHRLAAIRPDIVKLDRALVAGVRHSVEQTAVIEAIVSLCRRLNSSLLGEGIEDLRDLAALAELDVDYGQGHAIAAPQRHFAPPTGDVVAACQNVRLDLMRGRPAVLQAPFGADGMHAVTAALAGSAAPDDLRAALAVASAHLTLDAIGLSVIGNDQFIRELAAVGVEIEAGRVALSDQPTIRQALITGRVVEAHVHHPDLHPATRDAMMRRGLVSMLVAPLIADGVPLGVMHLGQRQATRWRAHQIAQARSLADHVASVLLRIRSGTPPLARHASLSR